MFGYVKPLRSELRVREEEAYKAVYCTLCHRLGKNYGPLARLTLSYDFAFLALLETALAEDCPGFRKTRCPLNPLARCRRAEGADLSHSARCAMVLLHFKTRDNIEDSAGLKRLFWRVAARFTRPAYRKAGREDPETARVVAEMSRRQREAERGPWPGLDAVCEPTARMLEHMFGALPGTDAQREALRRMGYCLGKWIYLADALDDCEKDRKKGNFNPLLNGDVSRERLLGLMNLCVGEAADAYRRLEPKRFGDMIANVLLLGLPEVQRQIASKESKQ